MITKQDSLRLQKDFRKVFVTKAEMNGRFDRVMSELLLIKKNFQKMEKDNATIKDDNATMKSEIINDVLKMKSEIINDVLKMKSDVMGELQAIRENQDAATFRRLDHSDQLEDHEGRIASLEAKVSPITTS